MKNKSVNLDGILSRELKNDEFRLAFDEHRFDLQIARLVSDLRARTGLSQVELATSYLINDIKARNTLKLLISGRVGAKPDVWI